MRVIFILLLVSPLILAKQKEKSKIHENLKSLKNLLGLIMGTFTIFYDPEKFPNAYSCINKTSKEIPNISYTIGKMLSGNPLYIASEVYNIYSSLSNLDPSCLELIRTAYSKAEESGIPFPEHEKIKNIVSDYIFYSKDIFYLTYGKAKEIGEEAYGKAKEIGEEAYGKAKEIGEEAYGKAKEIGEEAYGKAKEIGVKFLKWLFGIDWEAPLNK